MALPKIITVSGLDSGYEDGNGAYAFDGSGYTSTAYYSVGHDGIRWFLRNSNYVEIGYSDPCQNTVSPVDVAWGNTPAIDYINIYGSLFTERNFRSDGGGYWNSEDYEYYLTWAGTRWEIYDSLSELFAYTTSTTTSDANSLNGASWSVQLDSYVYELYLYPSFKNADIAISTPDELQAIGMTSYTLDGDYIQTATINMNVSPYNTGSGFSPIGNNISPFTGSFDGDHFEIQNFRCYRTTSEYSALFGYASNALIEKVKMRLCTIAGTNYIGGVTGRVYNSIVKDCSATGTVLGYGWSVGGLAGSIQSGLISRCWADVAVSCMAVGRGSYGGFAGSVTQPSGLTNVSDCYALGRVAGAASTDSVGGFVGLINNTANLTRCYALGLATGGTYVGQFSGHQATGAMPVITACYWISDDAASTSANGTRLSTAQAKDKLNYPGWNFRTLWEIHPAFNGGYPFLNPRKAPSTASSLYQSVYRKR